MLLPLIIVGLLVYFVYWELVGKRRGLPPGPQPLPLVGNGMSMDRRAPHKTIYEWSKKYGPVFTMWLGSQPNIMICDYNSIKKYMFGRAGDILTGRPYNFLFEAMFGGRVGVIFTDGDLWREQRRFTLHVLRDFGFGRSLLEDGVNDEIHNLIQAIRGKTGASKRKILEPREWEMMLELSVTSIVAKIVIGHGFKEDDEAYQIIYRSLKANENFFDDWSVLLLQTMPWLAKVPGFTKLGFDQIMANINQFQSCVQEELELHEKVFNPDEEPRDFAMAYLKEIHRREKAGENLSGFNARQLGAIMFDLWAAGTNTTVITLRFAFFYMLHHPDIQVQAELDALYGESERAMSMGDRVSLPYTAATVQEIQRCANIIPINIPHSPTEDMDMEGFNIPKGTTVTPQMSCIHIDSEVFPEPTKFKPERFLEKKEDGEMGLKKVDELMPFSMGKRVCAGESLARMELFMVFASVLRRFQFLPVPDTPLPPLHLDNGLITCVVPPEYKFEIRERTQA